MNEQEDLDKVQISRVLHYVSRDGACCTALVTGLSGMGLPNVRVFPDSTVTWRETSVQSDHKNKTIGTWHWPRECEDLHG